jgi:hypothetical protein
MTMGGYGGEKKRKGQQISNKKAFSEEKAFLTQTSGGI